MIKFIHCADVHLDAPFQLSHHVPESMMTEIKKSSFESFRRMVTDAIRHEVDFVLIAGDLLDRRNQSLFTLVFLREQFERLNDAHIFVYIIRGEKDHLKHHRIKWPENVVIFGEQVETYEFITKEGDKVYIHGFSYKDDTSYENKLEQYQTNQVDKSIHIGMLHGTYVNENAIHRLTEFRQEDLNKKLYHYWALGHIHDRLLLSDLPQIHYPGNMQSYHPSETGKKGYLFVEGDHVTMDVTFVPSQHIRFEKAQLHVTDTGKNALYQEISEFKDKVRANGRAIYQIELINDTEDLIQPRRIEKLLELLQQYEAGQRNFVWIDRIQLSQKHDVLSLHHEFDADVLNDEDLFSHALDVLHHDENISRFLKTGYQTDNKELLKTGELRLKARMRDDK